MTGMKIPVFERGSILTYDMLEQLKDYFMQAVTIPYAEYSDGILCGCRITMSNGIVQLGQGLICFQGKLLAVTDDLQVQVEHMRYCPKLLDRGNSRAYYFCRRTAE